MKQPELGRKLSELRKARGLTQEELVEKCNISVRTIQRIETGDVTPRSYTVRTILAALEYDFDEIFDEQSPAVTPSLAGHQPEIMRQINVAWIAGVIYFVIGFLEAAAEYFRYQDGDLVFGTTGYVIIKVIVLISFVAFQRGFITVATLYDNYLLKAISVLLIGANALLLGYDIASVFYDSIERQFVLTGAALCFGAMGIIYGIALRRLEQPLGRLAELAGISEILVACCFLTVVLAFIGFIIQIPAELFEIILLFRVATLLQKPARPIGMEPAAGVASHPA